MKLDWIEIWGLFRLLLLSESRPSSVISNLLLPYVGELNCCSLNVLFQVDESGSVVLLQGWMCAQSLPFTLKSSVNSGYS